MLTHSQITRGTKSLGEEEYYKWKRRKRKVQKWMSKKKTFQEIKNRPCIYFFILHMHYVLRSNDVVVFSEILIFIIRLFLGT